MLIKNCSSGKYLRFNGSTLVLDASLGSTGTSEYYAHVWRLADVFRYGALVSSGSKKELTPSTTFNRLIRNIGSKGSISINKKPEDAMWASLTDFSYTVVAGAAGTNSSFIEINVKEGKILAQKAGIATIRATHKVTNLSFTFKVYVDRYTYALKEFFKFSEEEAVLIRRLYDKIDNKYSNELAPKREWRIARILSSFTYAGASWTAVAGKAIEYDDAKRQAYFVDELGYTKNEYTTIRDAIKRQHASCIDEYPDFEHMQYSLSARLAFRLDLASAATEETSLMAGWLGDASLPENNETTSFKLDDYYADLDAEIIFRDIIAGASGNGSAAVYVEYYRRERFEDLNGIREECFLSYYSYIIVYRMVITALMPYIAISDSDPDEESIWEYLGINFGDTYMFLVRLSRRHV